MTNESLHTPEPNKYFVEHGFRVRYPFNVVCNGKTYARCESESDANKVANAFNRAKLLEAALKDLYKGYVSTLEAGCDRITSLGGSCDPLDVMEKNDPYLICTRHALSSEAE